MINYPDIESIILTLDDASDKFKDLYDSIEEKSKLAFLNKVYTSLNQKDYVENLMNVVILKQVNFDGHINYFSEKIDNTFPQHEDSALNEIDATNNWLLRRRGEVSSIKKHIEREKIRLERGLKINIPIAIKISEDLESEKIIDTLYKGLHPTYINIEKKEFSKHFKDSDFHRITWLGSDVEIKFLFDWFLENHVIEQKTQNKLVFQHFVTESNREFTSNRLSTAMNNSGKRYYELKLLSTIEIASKRDKSYKLLLLIQKLKELL